MRFLTVISIYLIFAIKVRGNIQEQEDPDLMDKSEGEGDPNSRKALYPPPLPADFAAPSLNRKSEPFGILDGEDDPPIPRFKRRHILNGPCHVSYGFKNNQDCYQGQVCVDKDTNLEVGCPLPPGSPCSPCMQGGAPAPICPRGCPLGQGCPALQAGTEDGLCVDPSFPSEDYTDIELTTLIPPQILKRGFLPFEAVCTSYGDVINKGLVENQEICSWAAARLECIPNEPRRPEGPDRPPGTCRCMLALGKKAVPLEDSKMGTAVCYIPANKGIDSECDHDIYLPYGLFEGVKPSGKPHVKSQDPAAKFCVPNSECRSGEKYTGLRCMCKKGAKWEEELGTCAGVGKIGSGEGSTKFLVIIGTFWIIMKINYFKL